MIERLTYELLASCFFFFFIITCYHDDWCNEVNDVYTELSSVATNCHRKSETSDPGPISLIIATLRVSWDLRLEETNTGVGAGMKNGLFTAVYPGFITLTSPMATYLQATQESIVRCDDFLLCLLQLFSFVRTSRDKCEVMISSRLRLITAKGFLRLSHHAHIQSLLSNNIFLAHCNFLDG